ncbi:MAG: NAD(P)/FAD-dependent oxidoreductase [Acidobacteriota bacterium]
MRRRFKGLRRQPPEDRYDAVVIGAGVGGLVCANLLVRQGLSVLLVERHYMVGGYCSTFRRGGFTFDAASHFYPLLGNPETLTGKLLLNLGVRTRWVRMDPVDTFHFPDGSRFEVPAELDVYRRRLDHEFPHQRQALDEFFAAVRRAYAKGLMVYFRERPETHLGDLAPLTVTDALDRHISDPKLRLLLTADCPHWGSPPERTSFVFDSMLRLSYFLGNYYPVGGSQAFADELARTFEARGGHILMSTAAERIEVEGDRVAGVRLTTDRGTLRGEYRVAAPVVVSNGDLLHTDRTLLATDRGSRPKSTGDGTYRHLRPSYPCFLVHIGLSDVSPAELAEAQGYYWRHWDPDRVGRDGLICKIFSPTLYDPSLAPEGGQIVILQKVQEIDYPRLEAEGRWAEHKAAVEAEMFGHLARVMPGIEQRVVVRSAASAHTSWRFTGNTQGAMLGWEMSPDQLGSDRPGLEGAAEGLYRVGHWVRPGGGITPVIVSAQQVAQRIFAGAAASNAARASTTLEWSEATSP